MFVTFARASLVLAVCSGLAVSARAQGLSDVSSSRRRADSPQTPALASQEVAVSVDSGWVGHDGSTDEAQVVFATLVRVPDAPWLRLRFAEVALSGDPAADGTIIRVTSMLDGATQTMNAEHVAQWHNTSAYFNGQTVTVELIARPGTGASRLVMTSVTAGDAGFGERSICGATDDRTLITDNKSARHLPEGCTAWSFNDTNSMFLSAGHCSPSASDVIQFNVPLSSVTGTLVNPPPQDQYVVDATSVQLVNNTIGDDWSYYGVSPNSTTGLTPFQTYGVRYTLGTPPNVAGQTIRVTGFGVTSAPVSDTWNQVEKTHTGAYVQKTGTTLKYTVDTTGGNSGSCIFDETGGRAIGIHTNAGCSATGGSNQGTGTNNAGLTTALANPLGVCKTGRGTPGGRLYAIGDGANNFGTLSVSIGSFARISTPIAAPQGLTYEPFLGVFYAIDNFRKLYTIVPGTGAATLLGTVSGTTLTLNGLAFDPKAKVLYAIAQSNGQLLKINTTTLTATTLGAPRAGVVGALEVGPGPDYDLYGINDSTASRLIKLDKSNGIQTVVGSLGAGIVDCNGLAFNPDDGQFYTINAGTEQLLKVNPATGVATVVGSTGGVFGSTFGMAAIIDAPAQCPADFNGDGFVTGEDFDAFVTAFEAGALSSDFNGDGFVTGEDFDAFVAAFETGC